MTSSLILAAWALLEAGAAPLAPATASVSQAVVSRAYEQLSPAICVLSYSYEITNPNTGQRNKQDAHSMGLIVSPKGLVMARGHIALDNVEPFNIRVEIGHGESPTEYAATLLRKPQSVNVVFMQIQNAAPLDLPFARFGKARPLKIGEPLVILGLLGATLDYNPAVAARRIGSILTSPRPTYCLDDAVSPGFIGGPVIDAEGNVVGVVGYDLGATEGGDLYVRSGQPLVYTPDLYTRYIDAPPDEKTATAEEGAWLGVFTQPLTDDLAEYWSLPKNGGAVVSTIVPGSPADAAGLQRGDVIVSFGDLPVRAKQDREVFGFTKMIRDAGVGKQVALGVLREGKPTQMTVTLAAQPKAARDAGEYTDELFGITARELTTDVRIVLNLPAGVQGVIVRRVESGSWAALGNIRPGVIILNFGGHTVTGLEDFKKAVAQVTADKPQEVTVFGRVGQMTGFFRLEPRWTNENK